jgi:hypothetical protein
MILNGEFRGIWKEATVTSFSAGIWKEAIVTSFSAGIRLEKIKNIIC